MLERIDLSLFSRRTWVYTSGDSMSAKKASTYEKALKSDTDSLYSLVKVPRARHVGEGVVSTIKSSLISTGSCVRVLYSKPDIVSFSKLVFFSYCFFFFLRYFQPF